MDGRNSSGRKISLLNEDASSAPYYHSRSSSYSSTPCLSPQTPHLVRSDSADSAIMQTPSPITPDLAYDGLTMSQQVTSPVFPYFQKDPAGYPAVPQSSGPLPYPTSAMAVQPQLPHSPPQTILYPQAQAAAAASSAAPERRQPSSTNGKSKKNSYPCPMAKQFNCHDYFTTSGHAARHAKKHTGKKDAYCPECNKAFTRKDNMEQHRRTHQNGRSTGKVSDDSRARKLSKTQLSKRPKPAPLQTQMALVDPALPVSPSSSFGFASAMSAVSAPYGSEYSVTRSAYPDPTQFAQQPLQPADATMRSPSFALDALAIACSEKSTFGT